jgi:hypothetical protein
MAARNGNTFEIGAKWAIIRCTRLSEIDCHSGTKGIIFGQNESKSWILVHGNATPDRKFRKLNQAVMTRDVAPIGVPRFPSRPDRSRSFPVESDRAIF